MTGDNDIVTVTMPGYVADGVASILVSHGSSDQGWLDLADMLREGGRDAEVRVTRERST